MSKTKTKKAKQNKIHVIGIIILVLVLVVFFGYYYFNSYCGASFTKNSIQNLESIYAEWGSAFSIAVETDRIDLGEPIKQMYQIQQKADELEVSPCLERSKYHLLKGMEHQLNAVIYYMNGQVDIDGVEILIKMGMSSFEVFTYQLEKVKECYPFCDNTNQ